MSGVISASQPARYWTEEGQRRRMSETSKHTVGPWRYQGEVTIEPGRPKMLRFEVYTVSGKFGHPATCDREEDARLIAAAPDLLAVVLDFRQKLATYTSVYDGDKELRRQLKDCDAAIAKAEGRASEVLAAQEGTR